MARRARQHPARRPETAWHRAARPRPRHARLAPPRRPRSCAIRGSSSATSPPACHAASQPSPDPAAALPGISRPVGHRDLPLQRRKATPNPNSPPRSDRKPAPRNRASTTPSSSTRAPADTPDPVGHQGHRHAPTRETAKHELQALGENWRDGRTPGPCRRSSLLVPRIFPRGRAKPLTGSCCGAYHRPASWRRARDRKTATGARRARRRGMLHDVGDTPEQRDLSGLPVACAVCHQVHERCVFTAGFGVLHPAGLPEPAPTAASSRALAIAGSGRIAPRRGAPALPRRTQESGTGQSRKVTSIA